MFFSPPIFFFFVLRRGGRFGCSSISIGKFFCTSSLSASSHATILFCSVFCSFFLNESSRKAEKKSESIGAFVVPRPTCQEIKIKIIIQKKHSPLCSLGDVMSWSHARKGGRRRGREGGMDGGDWDHAAIVLAGGESEGRWVSGGPMGLRRRMRRWRRGGPVSRLHRAGYHTVGGVR